MKKRKIILASNSPRRKELLRGLDVPFEVRVLDGIDETYPEYLPVTEIAAYIAQHKAEAYKSILKDTPDEEELLITADTIVVCGSEVMGKPKDVDDARRMLRMLSGNTHEVITGVCLTTMRKQRVFSVDTKVTFDDLAESEIEYYVSHYKPLDKAGAYGIQEWIGYIGVKRLEGSYFNVVGFPVQRIYKELKEF